MAPRSRSLAPLALLALALLAPGCRNKIGSACKVSTDCSLRAARTCDLSYLVDKNGIEGAGGKGECIVEGCTVGSCPKEAVCVQIYSAAYLSVACDPETEDRPGADGRDDCDPNEVCLPEGVCADANTARATCRRECTRDSTCRAGYSCRETGRGGVYVARDPENPLETEETAICMPNG
ncbi:MAG: hypothetical protein KC420_20795 [Myxococcales bacterium]|nr:hypothetical protein [Myxococcales bacterium]MCB9569258.1 hypothetical protein [Myxococcales bacterium]MCB9705857.1 hypothetical protein [Myxococcales bacterium]